MRALPAYLGAREFALLVALRDLDMAVMSIMLRSDPEELATVKRSAHDSVKRMLRTLGAAAAPQRKRSGLSHPTPLHDLLVKGEVDGISESTREMLLQILLPIARSIECDYLHAPGVILHKRSPPFRI